MEFEETSYFINDCDIVYYQEYEDAESQAIDIFKVKELMIEYGKHIIDKIAKDVNETTGRGGGEIRDYKKLLK